MYTQILEHRTATVEHSVPWGNSEVVQQRRGDGVLAFCPAKPQPHVRWPAPGSESRGLLVDAAATSSGPGMIALAFRWQTPLPGQPGGGGSVCLLRLDVAPSALRLQLLAKLPLDMPPAAISLRTDRDEGQMASVSYGGLEGGPLPLACCVLAIGFEEGGVEVSLIRRIGTSMTGVL